MTPQPSSLKRAREQATAYGSVFAPTTLELNDDESIEIPPHPNLRMLDDDCMAAYDELLFEVDTEYDREPDLLIPEQKLDNGVVIPEETRCGALLQPFRKTVDGKAELVKPPHSVRVVQAALGEDLYAKLRAGGKSAGDVWRIWNQQGLEIAARESADPKSNGGGRIMAPVSG